MRVHDLLLISARLSAIIILICPGLIVAKDLTAIPTEAVQLIKVVTDDLSKRLLLDVNDITLISIEEVIWPDTCLGLPAKDLCARTSTPGYKVVLQARKKEKTKEYLYHTDRRDLFRYVE